MSFPTRRFSIERWLAKFQLIHDLGFAGSSFTSISLSAVFVVLVTHITVAQQKELPATSVQRDRHSLRGSTSRSESKTSLASPKALTSTPSWRAGLPCPSTIGRYGFAQVGQDFYVISGVSSSGVISTGVYRYNVISRGWTTLAPIPVGSEAPAATYSSYDNKIYVADGDGGQNLLRIYNIANNSWSSASARLGVSNSYGAAAGAYQGRIYIAGGSSLDPNNVLSVYNIPNGIWSVYNNMPASYLLGGYTQVGRFLYLVGSYGITANTNSTTSMRLDLGTITWTTGPTWTPQRADFALAASGSKLIAIGGDTNAATFFDPSTAVNELETATWPSGSWIGSPADLPSPRQANQAGFFSVYRMGGEIWSTGGITNGSPLTFTSEHLFRANPCPSITFTGPFGFYATTYPGSSGTQKGNVTKNSLQSACGIAKAFPGIVNQTITFPFDQYSFTNIGPAACVTFTLDTECSGTNNTELFMAAYLGSYDPTNLAKNYLGDLGASPPDSRSFSVMVPANATVVLVVQQFVSHCNLYNVTVTGVNCAEFCSSGGPILIPSDLGSGGTSGSAGPYPSIASVSGVPGVISSMSVELNDLAHSYSGDIDMLLVSPAGQKMILMSDVGGPVGLDSGAATIFMRDTGIILPDFSAIATGLYVPTNYEPANDTFPAGAPAGPYKDPGPGGTPAGTASLYSSFAGFNPNGNWQLFINDDVSGDAGFLNGWCLKFHTIALQLTNAASRKSHNGMPFDINLPLTGAPGIECRSGAAGHTLVFTFTTNVVSGSASVTTGSGIAGAASFSGNTMTVPLTGVTDQQKIIVTLNGVTDVSSQTLPPRSVSMNVLLGDTTGNKAVNSTDVSQTKSRSGAVISAANFRSDTNVTGSINASDVSQVKANSGHAVP